MNSASNKQQHFSSYSSNPAKLMTLGFLSFILIGAFLLMLPISTVGSRLSFIDALFMATSGVCVTGLSVIDVGGDFTQFGQMVLLILMQAGGLGIMTFSFLFMLYMNIPVTNAWRQPVAGVSWTSDAQTLRSGIIHLLAWVLLVEFVGAVLIFLEIKQGLPFWERAFHAVFHSVSAFCNAGFSLYPDSLTQFSGKPMASLTFMFLIILGGLGYLVVYELYEWARCKYQNKNHRFSLYSKVCLLTSGLLVALGFVVIFFLEKNQLLAGKSTSVQIFDALFLAVSSRTAGFNTIPTELLAMPTLFFLLFLMFIGGCPGSTAGGVKVTTFTILLATIRSRILGLSSVSLMKRKVPMVIVGKSLAVFGTGVLILCVSVFILLLTDSHISFMDVLFETTSALGTVGLSTGVTAGLSSTGKLLVVMLMFAGRLGPLTLGLSIIARHRRRQAQYEYPEEEILIG